MKIITAQPDSDYFIWQLQVQLNSIRKFYKESDVVILLGVNGEPNHNAIRFARKTKATVEFLRDEREVRDYTPSIKPHLMKQFFKKNSLGKFLYVDCDLIFIDRLHVDYLNDPLTVYVSDCGVVSYLKSEYIKSKSDSLLTAMCDKVGIDRKVVESRDKYAGGAQYLFNMDLAWQIWEKIELDSVELYKLMTSGAYAHELNNRQIELYDYLSRYQDDVDLSGDVFEAADRVIAFVFDPEEKRKINEWKNACYPIQSWTAEMWSTIWNLWLFDRRTRVSEELDFCWATDRIPFIQKMMHNAGVTDDRKDLFRKFDYMAKPPFGEDFSYVNRDYCSYLYVKEIQETGENLRP